MNTNQGFESFLNMGKNLQHPMSDLNKATTEICQRLVQENIDILEENVSRFSDQLKRLGRVHRPEELISLQKDCFNEDISAAIQNMQKYVHMSMESMEDLTKLAGSAQDAVASTGKAFHGEKDKGRDHRDRSGK
ncbi:MAG: phasin family protein [Gammaproteobacteria bacterium]